MDWVLEFIARHGGPVVFGVVFVKQLGVPIPGAPLLLALGALAGSGRIDPIVGLALALVASVAADLVWYQLGRTKGSSILGLLCRIALEPDSCVSETRNLFARHGVKSLLVAKFIPGYDTVGPPLAGILGVRVGAFVAWTAAGALLWLGFFGGLGYLFADRIEELLGASSRVATTLAWILGGGLLAYLAWKYLERRRVLRSIRIDRIEVEEVQRMREAGVEVVILDARSGAAIDALPIMIEGARAITLEEIDARHHEIPRGREVIVYCS